MNFKKNNNSSEKKLSSTVVNLDYINDCFDGEKEPMFKVISIFLKQASCKIKELENGVLDKNYENISNASHFLKTSFTSMGIYCYKEICEIEELSKHSNSIEKISMILKNMLPAYYDAIEEYELLLEKLRSE